MSAEVRIDQFQGPLDLLLSLIASEKIDILDIPIARITDQYNEIISGWSVYDMEEASDYISMAARLLEIKARTLLPRKREREKEEDPREELAAQLAQYAVYKEIAGYLEALESVSAQAYAKDPEYFPKSESLPAPIVGLEKLERAMRRLLAGLEARRNLAPERGEEEHSVDAQKRLVAAALKERASASLRGLLSKSPSVDEVVATFLAVLELYKMGELDFVQEENEIYLSGKRAKESL